MKQFIHTIAMFIVVSLLICSPLHAADKPASNLFGVSEDNEVRISPRLESSMKRGLAYLASSQNPNGAWKSNYGNNVGEAALALLAFMAMGNLPDEGEYGEVVDKGVKWILAQAQPSGLIQNIQGPQAPVMYGHALATLMLSEVWGQSRDPMVGDVLKKAVELIIRVQGPQGGWNYESIPKDGDTSVCVMQIIALKSAQEAGIYVPQETIDKALELIMKRYDRSQKGWGYSNNHFNANHSGSSAAGATIMLICGSGDSPEVKEALDHHLKLLASKGKRNWAEYFNYYTAVSSYTKNEEYFAKCMKIMEDKLIKSQRSNGSWGSAWQTGFSILAGLLPYRYLPIYQR